MIIKLTKLLNIWGLKILHFESYHSPIELKEDLSFEVQPVGIIDQKLKELRNKVIPMVKVLWRSDTVEEMTWETETSMRNRYPYFFTD